MSVLIPRNSALPISRSQIYTTCHDNQTRMDIGVYQGEDLYADNNLRLDMITFENIPPRPMGAESVSVRFTYDINGILLVDAVLLSGQDERHLVLGVDEETEEIRDRIEMLKRLRTDPREMEETRLLQARAEHDYQLLADPPARELLARQLQRYVYAIGRQDIYEIQKEGSALTALLEDLERKYLSDFAVPDDYMEQFLDWYEQQGGSEDDEPQGWYPG